MLNIQRRRNTDIPLALIDCGLAGRWCLVDGSEKVSALLIDLTCSVVSASAAGVTEAVACIAGATLESNSEGTYSATRTPNSAASWYTGNTATGGVRGVDDSINKTD